MNKNEKNALIRFISIYLGSALLLIAVLLYLFYKQEIASIEKTCNMEVNNTSMNIKADIIDSYMHNKKYIPKIPKNKDIKYALFNKDKQLVFSLLDDDNFIDFSKKFYQSGIYHYYVEVINQKNIDIKYIVIQTCITSQSIKNLKIYIVVAFLLSALFVGFIAYFLAKIILKPVRERVKHLDDFIKDSAHELNTPISVLVTSVSMLKSGKNPDKMMKYILSSSKQISQIYNDIHFSAFDNFEENHEEILDLKELVFDSVEYFNDISVTKNISIEANLEECKVRMDRTKTQKIINNLISNAIKYSNHNSKIDVTLKNGILSVRDYGIGISQDEQEEIFKRYKRGDNIEGGFGIGLDIVRRVCINYDLKLTLKSKLNEGSDFKIDFNNIIISQ